MQKLSIALLLAATAMVPATAARAQATDAKCLELMTFVQDNDPTDNGITRAQAIRIVERDESELCNDALRMARGEISRDETAQNFDADATARIQVAVPDPEVTVQQAAPTVNVEQPQPFVSVEQGRPIVTVNQAEPVVRVEMSQPRITIEMPKPQILVEIPDPTVDVAMAQPRVTVNQAQPTVKVEQGEVKLKIGDKQTDVDSTTGEAKVAVTQQDAEVSIDRTQQARVAIDKVKPDVRYNAAEPRIEVSDAGEPQIEFRQSGEADVQFRQMTAEETRQDAERNQQLARSEQAETAERQTSTNAMTAPADAPRVAVLGANEQPAGAEGSLRRVTREMLLEAEVIGADGEEIGDVENVVSHGNQIYVLVGSGGFLGIGEKEVALPLSELRLRGENQLIVRRFTEDEVERMQDVDADDFQKLGDNDSIQIGTE